MGTLIKAVFFAFEALGALIVAALSVVAMIISGMGIIFIAFLTSGILLLMLGGLAFIIALL